MKGSLLMLSLRLEQAGHKCARDPPRRTKMGHVEAAALPAHSHTAEVKKAEETESEGGISKSTAPHRQPASCPPPPSNTHTQTRTHTSARTHTHTHIHTQATHMHVHTRNTHTRAHIHTTLGATEGSLINASIAPRAADSGRAKHGECSGIGTANVGGGLALIRHSLPPCTLHPSTPNPQHPITHTTGNIKY